MKSPLELINVVRHMHAYPDDSLETALRNTFDFDVYRKETIQKLSAILERHGFVLFYRYLWGRVRVNLFIG